jgi:hypothetical protein
MVIRIWRLASLGDSSLVSVVLAAGNQVVFGRDLRNKVRQSTRMSVSVRGDCRSVSHSVQMSQVPG